MEDVVFVGQHVQGLGHDLPGRGVLAGAPEAQDKGQAELLVTQEQQNEEDREKCGDGVMVMQKSMKARRSEKKKEDQGQRRAEDDSGVPGVARDVCVLSWAAVDVCHELFPFAVLNSLSITCKRGKMSRGA